MELSADFIEAFARLQISEPEITTKESNKLDEDAPLMLRKIIMNPTNKQLPQFFKEPPMGLAKMRVLLQQEARTLYLQQKSAELMDTDDQKLLYEWLEKMANKTPIRMKKTISYNNYCQLQPLVGAKCRKYLTATLFQKLNDLSPDYTRSVEIAWLSKYTMRKMLMIYYRICLTEYDEIGLGYLRKADLERFITDKLPHLVQLRENMPREFDIFYVCTVLQQCFFSLDPMHTGRIQITELLASGFMARFMELGDEPQPRKMFVPPEALLPNVFAVPGFLERYNQYLKLDVDQNGLLSLKELAQYRHGSFNMYFLKRIYEEFPTYNGGIDYKVFLEFAMVLENLTSSAAMHYMFRLLDVYHTGFLTPQNLQYFFKGLNEIMIERGLSFKKYEDFCNEIFDMVRPQEPWKMTLADIKHCKQVKTIFSIIIDFDELWIFDHRDGIYNF